MNIADFSALALVVVALLAVACMALRPDPTIDPQAIAPTSDSELEHWLDEGVQQAAPTRGLFDNTGQIAQDLRDE